MMPGHSALAGMTEVEVERDDLVAPAWRRFVYEHAWPGRRLDSCSLDELQRLRNAVPFFMASIDQAIDRKRSRAR